MDKFESKLSSTHSISTLEKDDILSRKSEEIADNIDEERTDSHDNVVSLIDFREKKIEEDTKAYLRGTRTFEFDQRIPETHRLRSEVEALVKESLERGFSESFEDSEELSHMVSYIVNEMSGQKVPGFYSQHYSTWFEMNGSLYDASLVMYEKDNTIFLKICIMELHFEKIQEGHRNGTYKSKTFVPQIIREIPLDAS